MPSFSSFLFSALIACCALISMDSQSADPSSTSKNLSSSETFTSGKHKMNVIELYTSEGCSSCPPADKWLSQLREDDRLFKSVIPLAFHVDYWNYLGWPDEFSDESYSQRQRRYHQTRRTASVYTPGFVVNGEEWRGFFNPLQRSQPPISGDRSLVGELTLVGEGDAFRVSFTPTDAQPKKLELNLVYLGTDLSTEIKRGENAGKRLEHDFVVLAHTKANLEGSDYLLTTELKRANIKHATAVAAWVSKPGDPAPIQAVGGWLAGH